MFKTIKNLIIKFYLLSPCLYCFFNYFFGFYLASKSLIFRLFGCGLVWLYDPSGSSMLSNLYYSKEHWEEAKKYPFRSVEYWPGSRDIRAVALLLRDPELDLGALTLPDRRVPGAGEAVDRHRREAHVHGDRLDGPH